MLCAPTRSNPSTAQEVSSSSNRRRRRGQWYNGGGARPDDVTNTTFSASYPSFFLPPPPAKRDMPAFAQALVGGQVPTVDGKSPENVIMVQGYLNVSNSSGGGG